MIFNNRKRNIGEKRCAIIPTWSINISTFTKPITELVSSALFRLDQKNVQ
jgi:hypothetical protein